MEYNVIVEETLSRIVKVKANNEDEAKYKAKKMYRNQEIVLVAEDFLNVKFFVYR